MSATEASTSPQAKITLHWLEVSRSHRIMWLLEELQIPYELKRYKRLPTKMAEPALKEVHPLGKSPVLEVQAPGSDKPIILIESAAIVEYLCDYYGKHLIPQRYQDGKEGQIGQETEQWLRYRKFMHYAEGSIMPFMVFSLVVDGIRNSPVPFFLKPVTRTVADKVTEAFLTPNYKTHCEWIDSELATIPNGGQWFCGELSGADIMMSFPMEAIVKRTGLTKKDIPHIFAWVDRLHERDAYKKSIQKIIDLEGKFDTNL